MNDALLHPQTAKILHALATAPPQALLFCGDNGCGKTFVATTWLQNALGAKPHQVRVVTADEKAGISVAQIRELYHTTRGKSAEPHYFILEQAGQMSLGAQNAFLKLLEEPGQHVFFILTASSPDELLPTIQSRTQHVSIFPLDDAALAAHLKAAYKLDQASLAQILFVAHGRAGMATRLANDADLLAEQRLLAAAAKTLVSGTPFERLVAVGSVGADRQKAAALLELTGIMTRRLLENAKPSDQAPLVRRLEVIHETLERLAANANAKIQLTRFALSQDK